MADDSGGYVAVLSQGPVRRLLFASLSGRVAFSMLPLGFVLFGVAETDSNATAGAMVAAFVLASALAPIRGRIVDRHGGIAMVWFACACSSGIAGLVLAATLGAPGWVLVVASALPGLVLPPLGPFTRAAWGLTLREGALQRAFALDSAGEEGALIVAPLFVSVAVALASPRAALLIAAAGMLAGTIAAGRSRLGARVAPTGRARAPTARLPAALWLMFGALAGTAAALGAIDVAVPAATREAGHVATAGVLLSVMAVGTVTGSLLAGGAFGGGAPERRVVVLQLVVGAGVALAALAVGAARVAGDRAADPGGRDRCPVHDGLSRSSTGYHTVGTGTQTFAWLVTANNGGIGVGAAVAGALSETSGAAAGLWFAAFCALVGAIPAAAAAAMSARGPDPPQTGRSSGVTSDKRRIKQPQGNGKSGEGIMSHWKH